MNATNEEFIRLYEALVSEVNRRAKRSDSHAFEIEKAAANDGRVRKYEKLLRYIRDIRHALQHPRHHSAGHAVIISEDFLKEVNGLLEHMCNPPKAGNLGVPLNQIRTARLNEQLGDLASDMKRNGFTHLPILNEQNAVIGVFNEAAVFDYLWSEDEIIISRSTPLSDILHHCRLDADHTEVFDFVSPRVSLDELYELFKPFNSATKRMGAVFLTASGKSSEPLQRLITPWDVLSISPD